MRIHPPTFAHSTPVRTGAPGYVVKACTPSRARVPQIAKNIRFETVYNLVAHADNGGRASAGGAAGGSSRRSTGGSDVISASAMPSSS